MFVGDTGFGLAEVSVGVALALCAGVVVAGFFLQRRAAQRLKDETQRAQLAKGRGIHRPDQPAQGAPARPPGGRRRTSREFAAQDPAMSNNQMARIRAKRQTIR